MRLFISFPSQQTKITDSTPVQKFRIISPTHHLIIPKRPSTHTSTHQKGYLHIVLATLLTLTERIQRLCVILERSLFHIHVFSLDSYATHSIVVFSLDLAVLFMNPKTRKTTAPLRPEFDCQSSFVSQLVCRSVRPSAYLVPGQCINE